MKNSAIENFKKIEKEIKKLICALISVKDENEALKIKVHDLEIYKSSLVEGLNENQKIISDHESLKNNYNKIFLEKKQLREKVDQMLKKLEPFQF